MRKYIMTITTKIAAAVAADQSRDQIIIGLVSEDGLSLNKATNEYAAYAKANGLTTTVVSHKAEAKIWLSETVDVWDHEAVSGAVIDLQDRYDIAESTARDYTKAYSESLGVIHPTLNPRTAMFDWLVANAEKGTKAEFKEYAKGLGRSDSNINEYWKGMELHRAILSVK